jgi:hypothetical protein
VPAAPDAHSRIAADGKPNQGAAFAAKGPVRLRVRRLRAVRKRQGEFETLRNVRPVRPLMGDAHSSVDGSATEEHDAAVLAKIPLALAHFRLLYFLNRQITGLSQMGALSSLSSDLRS